jgi:hypothetical protein
MNARPELTRKILLQEELKSADVIIGPLFPEEAKPVLEFSQANQVNALINPASNTIEFAPIRIHFYFSQATKRWAFVRPNG